MKIIARIKTDFPTKFGLPRQSGLIKEIKGKIIFEKEYRVDEAFRGLEGYSHIWLLWQFSLAEKEGWSPTVRPPMLGGNKRMGVFATRSPYRPNPIGLSSVKLEKIEYGTPDGPVLYVSGADLVDNTPIYDIKPYLCYADSHPDAVSGFADTVTTKQLKIDFKESLLERIPKDKRAELIKALEQDPRPSYQSDSERIYGFYFSDFEILFKTDGNLLTVVDIK